MPDEMLLDQPGAAPVESGNAMSQILLSDVNSEGAIKTDEKSLALVVQSAAMAKSFIASKQWTLLWRDADLLYQSPRPMTVYENTSNEWGTLSIR